MPEQGPCCCAACSQGDLEEIPMRRYSNPIPACPRPQEPAAPSCGRHEELDQILAALACQNQLLVDLLGAVNCLTAALLAGHCDTRCP